MLPYLVSFVYMICSKHFLCILIFLIIPGIWWSSYTRHHKIGDLVNACLKFCSIFIHLLLIFYGSKPNSDSLFSFHNFVLFQNWKLRLGSQRVRVVWSNLPILARFCWYTEGPTMGNMLWLSHWSNSLFQTMHGLWPWKSITIRLKNDLCFLWCKIFGFGNLDYNWIHLITFLEII